MKLLHIADLHIGCRLGNLSLAEDQRAMLDQLLAMASGADAVIIAGDLYHRAQPGGEAVRMVGGFLADLASLGRPVFVIAGNHDGGELVDYCGGILDRANIHAAGVYDGALQRHVLRDEYGEVHVYLMPFVKPLQVRAALRNEMDVSGIVTYEDAVRAVLTRTPLDPCARNVLVAHQFVSGASLSGSEERTVGGLDQISLGAFEAFDYVALGHLHAPQRMAGGRVCYSGSPLKYALSEAQQRKGALSVTLGAKGELDVEELPVTPLRDVRMVRGTLAELTAPECSSDDFIGAGPTDPVPPLDPLGALRVTYPNLVGMRLEAVGGEAFEDATLLEDAADRDPLEHFAEFYTRQNGRAPDGRSLALMRAIIEGLEVEGHASH